MKKIILFALMLLSAMQTEAKKVKFVVDMAGQTLNPTGAGMHIAGDFQTVAGFPNGDWQSNTTMMLPEAANPNWYSVIVDIPAFAKYEFKFVNGDQFYETEFVPEKSRVGYDFNDNRWVYIDSLANDTTLVGPIRFGENAPNMMYMTRLKVDMTSVAGSVGSQGVRLVDDGNMFMGGKRLFCFLNDNIYETIIFAPIGIVPITTLQYRFGNGFTAETVPTACAVGGKRVANVSSDTLLTTVCFAQCTEACVVSTEKAMADNEFKINPNPSDNYTIVSRNDGQAIGNIRITDMAGRLVHNYQNIVESTVRLDRGNLTNGVYFVQSYNQTSEHITLKWVLQ